MTDKSGFDEVETDLANFLFDRLDRLDDDMIRRFKAADLSLNQFYTVMVTVCVEFAINLFIEATAGNEDTAELDDSFAKTIYGSLRHHRAERR